MRGSRVKILSLEDEAARLNGPLGEGWPLGTEGSRRLAEDAAHAAAHPEDFEDDGDTQVLNAIYISRLIKVPEGVFLCIIEHAYQLKCA